LVNHSEAFKGLPVLKKNILVPYFNIVLVLFALTIMLPAVSFAATDTLEVKAYGSAVNSGNSGATRDAALSGALRDAVTSAVKEYLTGHGIEADEQVMAREIYSRADSYIINYKILSERWISETPDVTEPAVEGDGRGKMASEGGAGATAEKEKKSAPDTYHVLIDATLDMGAIKKAIIRIMGAEDSVDLKLVLLDISDYETFTAIMNSLKRVAIIEDISYESFSRERFVVWAHTVMDPAALAVEIGREAGPDFAVTAYGTNTIIIKAFPGTETSGTAN